MKTTYRLITLFLYVLLAVPATFAQQVSDPSSAAHTQDVTIIIQKEQVRFTSQKAVQMMQLNIFNQAGEPVYDSGPLTVPEINWPLQAANGEALKSGLYAYTLTVQESDASTARVRRGHFIVDRAQDRDGKTDKLWVTSQNDSSIGTELTVARNDSGTVAGTSTTSERTTTTQRDTTQRDTIQRDTSQRDVTEKSVTKSAAASAPAALSAVSGTIGQIAKFTSGTDLGNSVMIEKNGNIGIGTVNPESPLHIHGASGLISSGSGAALFFRNRETTTSTDYWGWYSSGNIARFWRSGIGDLLAIKPDGSVGIGTTLFSSSRMTIEGQDALTVRGYEPFMNLQDSNDSISRRSHRIQSAHGDLNFISGYMSRGTKPTDPFESYISAQRMVIKDSGNVGIGTSFPSHQLSLGRGPSWTRNGWGGSLELENASAIGWKSNVAGNRFGIGQTNTGLYFFRTTSDPGTTGSPAIYDMWINDIGVVNMRTLTITGGADFAENFDVNAVSNNVAELKIEAGMVVAIDPVNPGKLTLSTQAYNRRVAGIISGAGGVNPGMRMSQTGTLADGQHPIALSGRVYCWVDASQGAIEPGDFLTTSNTPGHAMKVTDAAKSQGAIIGKAMTGLTAGKGLVLVLVTLQ